VDVDTSETSSYASDQDIDMGEVKRVVQPKKPKKEKVHVELNAGNNSDGDEGSSTYNKFATKNEVEIGEAYKTGPLPIRLDDLDEIVKFG